MSAAERFAFIGLGQIGGMLALRARKVWPDAPIVACDDQDQTHGEFGKVLPASALGAAVKDATFVIVAAPVAAAIKLLPEVLAAARKDAVVIDTCSVKGALHAAAGDDPRFVGGHPMCGNEGRGFASADADALVDATFVLTRGGKTSDAAFARAQALVTALGAVAVERSPKAHDEEVAKVSHLPQVLASLLAQSAPEIGLAGPGFRDMTRLAASPSLLWAEIAASNAGALIPALHDFAYNLIALTASLERGESLQPFFNLGNAARARLPAAAPQTLASRVAESATAVISARVQQRKRQGLETFSFNVGELHLPLSPGVSAALREAMAGAPITYTEGGGVPELRELIAQSASHVTGHGYALDEVLATSGAKQALHLALGSIVGPGDEVIVVQPAWVSFVELVRYAGAKPIAHAVGERPLPVTPRTRAIVLNTPNNPTGAAYDPAWLSAALGQLPKDAWVISDEIYRTFNPAHVSPLRQVPRERAIFVDGISKSHGMTGLRIGFVAAPRDIAARMRKLASQETSCASSVSQAAAIALLREFPDGDPALQQAVRERTKRVRAWADETENALGLKNFWPVSGPACFYAWLDLTRFGGTSASLCADLLANTGVAVMPGEAFGTPGHARLCYAVDARELDEGLARFGKFLAARLSADKQP